MENSHITVLEIDLNAVSYNLDYFKSKLLENTKILAVVKAFGYGSNSIALAKHIAKKVSYFGVAYTDEAIALRAAGINNPILVLHPQIGNLNLLIQHNLEPNIYSLKVLNSFITVLKSLGKIEYPIHLKINTGLNRLGFLPKDIEDCISIINAQNEVSIKSIFSHISASEDPDEVVFTTAQIETFNSVSDNLCTALKINPMRHMLNTSGVLNYAANAQFDMVRIGIGLLGFGNEEKETKQLKNVLRLTSVISQIHHIQQGESVGYNRAFKAKSEMKTATIPIGHADGISRQLGNGNGYVFIHGKKAAIVGNVCMDMIMVDITTINCKEGDTVEVYKNQAHIEELALAMDTIPYELLTAISQRIKRISK